MLKKLIKICILSLAISLFIVSMTNNALALTVKDVRVGTHPDKTRLVLELDQKSAFKVFMLESPQRLVIDMPAFNWKAGQIGKPVNSPIKTIRQGKINDNASRIVIDLKGPITIKTAFFLGKDSKNNKPDRIVIDVNKSSEQAFKAALSKSYGDFDNSQLSAPPKEVASQKPANEPENQGNSTMPTIIGKKHSENTRTASASIPEPKEEKTSAGGIILPPAMPKLKNENNIKAQKQKEAPPPEPEKPKTPPMDKAALEQVIDESIAIPQRKPQATTPAKTKEQPAARPVMSKPVIVVDAGHGGVDPGAIGANGIFEKHVTLAIAKELKYALESTGRYTVHLTRNRDIYERLKRRVEIARQYNADLFISLHADSIGKSNVRGASIYTLSEKASDAQTARLAERENKADIIAGVDISHEDKQVADILIDLAMRDTMNQSKFFANTLAVSIKGDNIRLLEKPTRSAGFAVLKAPDIPSVLIETGFMSNKKEAAMLATASYQRKIAKAISEGVDVYFEKIRKNNKM